MIPPMDVRQLESVIAVMDKGSLGRAAAALNVSQPALTKTIQRLEQRLGVPLFYRDSKGMRPTVYGELLRDHARGIAAGMDQALREIEAMRTGSQGTVRVAAGPLMTSEILASAIVTLMREQPSVRVSIHTAIGDPTPDLLAGKYDLVLALLPLGAQRRGLLQRQLVSDRICVIARPDHPLARRRSVAPRDLVEWKWVLPEPGHNHRRRFSRVFEAANVPMPEPDIECSSTEFIKSVVMRTQHLGLIAQMGITDESRSSLLEIGLHSPFMVRPIGIVWRQHQVLSKAARLLIAAIEDACRADRRDASPSPPRSRKAVSGVG
jgi:DNA-binding transcriptional LysR family regulator